MNTVVEIAHFTDMVDGRLTAAELRALIDFVSANPKAGDLIPGAGGARKMRWGAVGRGKSGGARIITYWHCDACPVYLLDVYLKNEASNLTRAEIAALKTACKELADEHS